MAENDLSHDAVVIIPGNMGSEQVDPATGTTPWGLRDPRWYVSARTTGAGPRALCLDEGERAGRVGRVWAAVADPAAPLDAAAPDVLLDAEGDQTVHRLAHRTFQEHSR